MTGLTHPRTTMIFPKGSGLAIATALALTMAAIGTARLSGFKPDTNLPAVAAQQVRHLQFEDADKGVVVVRDAESKTVLKKFDSGQGAFVRATIRALVNDRKRKGITAPGDFRLEVHQGQRLFLIDEASGKALSLNAFGPDNAAAFAAFM
jgi:putative photosynthetic complex assembly protein